MKEINWKHVASMYDLTPDQLKNQVMSVASILATMQIDKSVSSAHFVFTCNDVKSDIELTVKRINHEK